MREESSSSVRIYYPRFSRGELIERLRRCAEELSKKLPLKRVILFGSYASGRQTAASDVDVLIVYEGERDKREVYDLCWDLIGLPNLELHLYSEDEYLKLRKLKHSIIWEAESKGIIIWEG